MQIIQTNNLKKSYGKVEALKGVSLSIEKGEIFGLIGADGAGKTTLFRILTTLILPDTGDAVVNNNDIIKDYKNIRNSVGYMPGRFSLYGDLSVEENINLFAAIFGTTLEKNRDVINDIYTQIEPFKARRASKLSGGMKQKLALCCALIHSPEILFLDEPTTGVDPVSRKEFWEILKKLNQQGMTIIVSTPYMDEAKQCTRMAFIKEGKILEIDTPQQVVSSFGEALYAISATKMHTLLEDIKAYNGVKSCFAFGDTHHFTVENEFDFQSFKEYLTNKDYKNIIIETITPTVEDCYIKLVNR